EPVWCSIAGPRRRTDHGRGWTSQRLAGSGRSWNRRVRGDRRSLLYSPFEKLALRSRRAPRFHRPTNMRRLSYNRSVKRPQRSFVPRQTEAPYRIWGTGLEPDAVQQLKNACQLPVAVSGALMPDAHVGYGLPIGGVLATRDAVIPYAVGVDIACRMKMSVLDLPLTALVDEQDRLKQALQRETQFGIGASFKTRRQHEVMDADWYATRVTAGLKDRAWAQLGTSGSGNHFVEFGQLTVLDPAAGLPRGEYLALLSHSGSRGSGAHIAQHYSRLARDLHPELPRELSHLAWLDLSSEAGQEYWTAMELMGRYAAANHALIHQHIA